MKENNTPSSTNSSKSSDGSFNFKNSNIRIWIHQRDIGKLQQVIWEGLGSKLLVEHSNSATVKKFLESVPHIMGLIKDIHKNVLNGDLESLQEWTKDPVPAIVLSGKDSNGLTPLHKAAGLGKYQIADYIISKYPGSISLRDNKKRIPLHYAPLAKDDGKMFEMLVQNGSDQSATDYRDKTPTYYKTKYSELEPSFLNVLPDCPRIAKPSFLNDFDWEIITSPKIVVERRPRRKPDSLSTQRRNKSESRRIKKEEMAVDSQEEENTEDLSQTEDSRIEDRYATAVITHKRGSQEGATEVDKVLNRSLRNSQENKTLNKTDGKKEIDKEMGAPKKQMQSEVKPEEKKSTANTGSKSSGTGAKKSEPGSVKSMSEDVQHQRESKRNISEATNRKTKSDDDKGNTDTGISRKNPDVRQDSNGKHPQDLRRKSGDDKEHNGKAEHHVEDETKDENRERVVDTRRKSGEDNKKINRSLSKERERKETELKDSEIKDNLNENKPGKKLDKNDRSKSEGTNKSHQINKQEEDSSNGRSKSGVTNTKTHVDDDNDSSEKRKKFSSTKDQKSFIKEDPDNPNERRAEKNMENLSHTTKNLPGVPTSEKEISRESESRKGDDSDNKETLDVSYMRGGGDEGVIEGFVQGDNEIESLNYEGTNRFKEYETDSKEVEELIENSNMEQLAALVLNGNGNLLVGRKSNNPEIQAFLDNVPIYMSKINRIHCAARSGSLKDLQAALDRRKFAIAKDVVSPNGATALHVSILFGNTSIVRYLAGRFPETVNATDDKGRSPLHYAATLDDNGHYYNLLVHLGADQYLKDSYGFTPEYYKRNRNELSHRNLLTDFGGEELADEILKDKDKEHNNGVEMPFFWTEEGRYLASSLGDPLIKGLTEIANKRPEDPIAYLASYLSNFTKNGTNHDGDIQEHTRDTYTTSKTEPISSVEKKVPQRLISTSNGPNSSTSNHIDVVTIDSNSSQAEGNNKTSFSPTTRDEHGQSMLHFAAARTHNRNALFQLLQETEINVGFRDELYRTARDISIQADIPENTQEIDRYVLFIACEGDIDKLVELLLEGYDHIIDIVDENSEPILDIVSKKNQPETVAFLQSILTFEEKRERVHYAIRRGTLEEIQEMLADTKDTGSGRLLAISKNNYGRCSLHIAVLCQQEEIIDYLANTFPETLAVGDNLERTALHYTMGTEKIESISKILIRAGAKRVVKDLKGRQPTYYFLNKSDILRLQEEEETF